jgi:hypothetical protein
LTCIAIITVHNQKLIYVEYPAPQVRVRIPLSVENRFMFIIQYQLCALWSLLVSVSVRNQCMFKSNIGQCIYGPISFQYPRKAC